MATREELLREELALLEEEEALLRQGANSASVMPKNTGAIDSVVNTVGKFGQEIGRANILPTYDDVATGEGIIGSAVNRFAEQSGDGALGNTPLPGKAELFRRLGNMIIPQSLPSMDDVTKSADETLSSFNPMNILDALGQLPQMAMDREGKKAIGSGIADTANIANRVEKGDALGLIADLGTIPMGGGTSLLGKGTALTKNALRSTQAGGKALDVASGITRTPQNVINWLNAKGGLPPVAKEELRSMVTDPKKREIFDRTIAKDISPLDVAEKAREKVGKAIIERNDAFGKGLQNIDLNVEVPNWSSVVDDIRSYLKEAGVEVEDVKKVLEVDNPRLYRETPIIETRTTENPSIVSRVPRNKPFTRSNTPAQTEAQEIVTRTTEMPNGTKRTVNIPVRRSAEATPTTRTTMVPDGFDEIETSRPKRVIDLQTGVARTELPPTKRITEIKTGERVDPKFSPYVRGDVQSAENVLDAVNNLKNGSLGAMRNTFVQLSRAMNTKELLNSGVGDMLYAKSVNRIREAIADAAEVHGLPEAKALRQLQDAFDADTKKLKRLINKFSIRADATDMEKTIQQRMTNIFDDNEFLREDLELLRSIDTDSEILPSILAWKSSPIIPDSWRSDVLAGGQLLGMTGVAGGLGTLLGGLPVGALVAGGAGSTMSPRLIRSTTQRLERLNQSGIPGAVKQGISAGAANDRLQQRGQDILTQLSTIGQR